MISTMKRLGYAPRGIPSGTLLPLRLFLGGTDIYAGLYKLTDPQFFNPAAPGFIGRQMTGFAQGGSPLTPLLTHLAIPNAVVFGALIALGELWVGLGILVGVAGRLWALGGLALSLTLYLTASWNVHPYFLGNDLPYALGWLTLVLTGVGPYSLDAVFTARAASPRTVRANQGDDRGRSPSPADPAGDMTRTTFLRRLGATLAVLGLGGLAASLARWRTPSGSTGAMAAGGGPLGSGHRPARRIPLGSVTALPRNSARPFVAPVSGNPALLIHLPNGQFVAYDARCTHLGCPVRYDRGQHLLVCPCHGSIYDPAHGARVLSGPAPRPLQALPVRIDAQGRAYALVGDTGSEQAVGHGRVPGQAIAGQAAGDKGRIGPQ